MVTSSKPLPCHLLFLLISIGFTEHIDQGHVTVNTLWIKDPSIEVDTHGSDHLNAWDERAMGHPLKRQGMASGEVGEFGFFCCC